MRTREPTSTQTATRGSNPKRLTVRDVARRTGRSQKTVYRHIRAGKLAAELVTTPHGKLYLINEDDVESAGLPLVHTVQTLDRTSPASASLTTNGALTQYLKNEIAELKAENRRLRSELDRALFIVGVFRGRLETAHRTLASSSRTQRDTSRQLAQARGDAEYYKDRGPRPTKSRNLFARILGN